MIYELSLVTKPEFSAEQTASLQALVQEVVRQHEGDILIQDDWGRLRFAQPARNGDVHGHYLYFLYKANNKNNLELERRLGITEGITKSMIVLLGGDEEQDKIVKNYKSPYSKNYRGSVLDDEDTSMQMEEEDMGGEDMDGGRPKKRFSRRKSCVFSEKKVKADWKDPKSYEWLVNEFGKISPCRVTGITRKHQRFVTSAVKRARQMGLASYMASGFADRG